MPRARPVGHNAATDAPGEGSSLLSPNTPERPRDPRALTRCEGFAFLAVGAAHAGAV